MKLRIIASFVVFIGSYFPLSLILLAQDFRYELLSANFCWPIGMGSCVTPFRNWTLSISAFAVCLVCLLLSFGVLRNAEPKIPVDVIEAKYIPAELMAYTLPYVVSFMSLEYKDTGKFIRLLIFLGWMFVITYRSGQLILNPLLIAFGWRLYEVKVIYPGDTEARHSWALAKSDLQPNTRCSVATIQDVMIIKSNKMEAGD